MREVYGVLTQTRFMARAVDGRSAMLSASSRVLGLRIEEAFVLELDERGRIESATVHVRPWLGLAVFALVLGARMVRHRASFGARGCAEAGRQLLDESESAIWMPGGPVGLS